MGPSWYPGRMPVFDPDYALGAGSASLLSDLCCPSGVWGAVCALIMLVGPLYESARALFSLRAPLGPRLWHGRQALGSTVSQPTSLTIDSLHPAPLES